MSAFLRPFRRVQTADRNLNLIQDYLSDIVQALNVNPFIFGKPIYQVALVTGDNFVSHGLGRNWVACFVSIPSTAPLFGGGLFLEPNSLQADRSQFVVINAAGACTVDLYVF
jgi:hypothetical protein